MESTGTYHRHQTYREVRKILPPSSKQGKSTNVLDTYFKPNEVYRIINKLEINEGPGIISMFNIAQAYSLVLKKQRLLIGPHSSKAVKLCFCQPLPKNIRILLMFCVWYIQHTETADKTLTPSSK